MKVLVTGCDGFIGRHMWRELAWRGHAVDACDLRNGRDALSLFESHADRYDLVVHCAYHVGGRAAIDGEPRLLARNLHLDAALFDWAARTRQGRVLYFSSAAAYPVDLQAGLRVLREDDIHLGRPNTPDARYGWAKLTGEHLAAAARETGVPVTVVRPFSGYGEDQDDSYPFRAFVERARRREDPFVVWGPGTQVRDWVHVDDVVHAALAVAEAGTTDPVNLCTGIGTSMFDLARMVCAGAGYHPIVTPQPDRPTGVAYRVGDPGRMSRYWTAKVALDEGIRRALGR